MNINDALDELEDQIVEYVNQPINSEETLDMKKESLGLKKDILDKCRKGDKIDIELEISSQL